MKCFITCCKYIGLDLPRPSVEQGKEGEDAQYCWGRGRREERGGGGKRKWCSHDNVAVQQIPGTLTPLSNPSLTVAVNKKLTFRFRFTIVERAVLSNKTNRKRSHNYLLYGTVRYVAKVTTVWQRVRNVKDGRFNQAIVLWNDLLSSVGRLLSYVVIPVAEYCLRSVFPDHRHSVAMATLRERLKELHDKNSKCVVQLARLVRFFAMVGGLSPSDAKWRIRCFL